MQKIITNFWFKSSKESQEAVDLYTSLFPDSKIVRTDHVPEGAEVPYIKPGEILTIEFELAKQKFIILNGGPVFDINPSISLSVECETEEQVD